MTSYFINGGAPNYTGHLFTTTSGLLSVLQSTFTSAGWTVFSSTSTSLVVTCHADCFISFDRVVWTGGPTNGYSMTIRGLHSTNVYSPSDQINSLLYVEGSNNYLWGVIDEDSGCLCTTDSVGVHFGYLDRPNPASDRWGWMVGNLSIDMRYPNSYWAKSFFDSTNWKSVGASFTTTASATYTANIVQSGAFWGVIDRYTTAVSVQNTSTTTTSNFLGNTVNTNAGYGAHNGQVNGVDSKPVVGEFYYVEGRTPTSYGSAGSPNGSLSIPLFFRGNVKHAVVGLASLPNKAQVVDTYGRRFISSGGIAVQGFRIL